MRISTESDFLVQQSVKADQQIRSVSAWCGFTVWVNLKRFLLNVFICKGYPLYRCEKEQRMTEL